ncbi:MAG: diphthine--ammonia ligase [Candidatus Altiarchaeota archaeon]
MRVAVLFSGGKDSTYALYKAGEAHEVVCLITLISRNPESYMFHTPNINLAKLQAEAIGLPLLEKTTTGVKEEELTDLEDAILEAKGKYRIEGVVTGAIASVYQAERIRKLCDKLGLECINPLWGIDQVKLLHELVESEFKVIISGVFAYPFDESWLGRVIDDAAIEELVKLKAEYKINPSGEGGEIETTVLDTPFFRRRVEIQEAETSFRNNAGVYMIKKAKLVGK